MMAMSLGGPLVAGIAVGVTAALQLGMAFSKVKEKAKSAADQVAELNKRIAESGKRSDQRIDFEFQMAGMDEAREVGAAGMQRAEELIKNDSKAKELERQRNAVRAQITLAAEIAEHAPQRGSVATHFGDKAAEEKMRGMLLQEKTILAELNSLAETRQRIQAETNRLLDRGKHLQADEARQAVAAINGPRMAQAALIESMAQQQRFAFQQGAEQRRMQAMLDAQKEGTAIEGIIQRARESVGQPARSQAQGPSGFEQGSKGASDIFRQAMLQQNQPKTETPELLKRVIAAIEKMSGITAEQKQIALDILKAEQSTGSIFGKR
jgi:hypothetical protein